jgi:hypothetical protein
MRCNLWIVLFLCLVGDWHSASQDQILADKKIYITYRQLKEKNYFLKIKIKIKKQVTVNSLEVSIAS